MGKVSAFILPPFDLLNMDDITRETLDDLLQRALERLEHALHLLDSNSPAMRDLGVARRLIEAAQSNARQSDAPYYGASFDGDAPHRASPQADLPPMPPLTLREEQVVRLMAAGLRNKEVAARLGVSERTATFHVGNVLSKLGADGRMEAIHFARQRGLL